MQFFEEGDLSRLYDLEYNKQYLSGIFGAFLPTEKERWVEQMFATQGTVQTRVMMVGGDLHETAARLMFYIIKGHKLADGNKRSSLLYMIGFYVLNGYNVKFNPEDLYNKTKEVAKLDSQIIDDEEEIQNLATFCKKNTKKGVPILW